MKQRPRIYYSDTQKALMWDRWQKGDSMNAIIGVEVPVLVSKQPYTKRNFQRCDGLDAAKSSRSANLSPHLCSLIGTEDLKRDGFWE